MTRNKGWRALPWGLVVLLAVGWAGTVYHDLTTKTNTTYLEQAGDTSPAVAYIQAGGVCMLLAMGDDFQTATTDPDIPTDRARAAVRVLCPEYGE